jgi:hypothetical protein
MLFGWHEEKTVYSPRAKNASGDGGKGNEQGVITDGVQVVHDIPVGADGYSQQEK